MQKDTQEKKHRQYPINKRCIGLTEQRHLVYEYTFVRVNDKALVTKWGVFINPDPNDRTEQVEMLTEKPEIAQEFQESKADYDEKYDDCEYIIRLLEYFDEYKDNPFYD